MSLGHPLIEAEFEFCDPATQEDCYHLLCTPSEADKMYLFLSEGT